MYRWREEMEPVKWKYAWNCDKKRKRARESQFSYIEMLFDGENRQPTYVVNDSILWMLPSKNCHNIFFIEIIVAYSNIYSPNDLPDSQYSSTQAYAYRHRLNIWRALNR